MTSQSTSNLFREKGWQGNPDAITSDFCNDSAFIKGFLKAFKIKTDVKIIDKVFQNKKKILFIWGKN